eukprot:2879948-Prymnesium_polylepis.1
MRPPIILFAAVKSADGGSTLALASTQLASRTWEEGLWVVKMRLRFCVEREKVVQHYEPPSTSDPREVAFDRWVVPVAVELYLLCDDGMRLLGRTALVPPAYCDSDSNLMPEYDYEVQVRGGWIGVNPIHLNVFIEDDLDIPNFELEDFDEADAQRRAQDITNFFQRESVKAYFAKFHAAKA